MTGLLILFGGIVLFVTIIGTLDFVGQRQRRRQREARDRAA